MKNQNSATTCVSVHTAINKTSQKPRSARTNSISIQLNSIKSFSAMHDSPTHKKISSIGISTINEVKTQPLKFMAPTRKSMCSLSYKTNETMRISPIIMFHKKIEEIEKLPLTSEKALKIFSNNLTNHEKLEILAFREIFYVGPEKKPETFTFDDTSSNLVVYENDHIAYRYQVKRLLGLGSFSQVYEVYDWKTRTNLAMKVLRNKEKYKKQAEKEIVFLKLVKEKASSLPFANMLTSFEFRGHICIVFTMIGPEISTQPHSASDVLRFTFEILNCLQFLHQHKIVHCDVKPSNILVSQNEIAHLIDLGTATYVNEQVYKYVQSRNYRAPEVILRLKYTTKADMWSFGCVLFEVVKGKRLFDGKDEAEVMEKIVWKIGKPPKEWSKACEQVWSGKGADGEMLGEEVEDLHPVLREIIVGCVRWNPAKRISASDALSMIKK